MLFFDIFLYHVKHWDRDILKKKYVFMWIIYVYTCFIYILSYIFYHINWTKYWVNTQKTFQAKKKFKKFWNFTKNCWNFSLKRLQKYHYQIDYSNKYNNLVIYITNSNIGQILENLGFHMLIEVFKRYYCYQ